MNGNDRTPPDLLILTDDFGGGTGNHILGMLDCWASSGWQPEIVSFARRTARREPSSVHTRLPPPSGPDLYPIRQIARLRQVARLVRERSPDILHAYFFWPILFGRWLRAIGAVPRLVENREDEGFAWGPHEYAWLRLTRNIPDRIICVSEAVRRAAIEREGLSGERTRVIHNGIEMPPRVSEDRIAELTAELGLTPNSHLVGMVANLNRGVKGVDRFLDAVPRILDEEPSARFVVVGGGSDEAKLRSRAAAEGLDDYVHFPGYREDVDVFYELMDVSVLTSFSEGLSITLLESMSHGLPVVATRVGGNPEVVEDGVSGFLVAADDLDSFSRQVIRLLRDATLRRRIGEAAADRVRTDFTIRHASSRYRQLYGELLRSE